MKTTTLSAPEHVREVVVERGFKGNDLAIKVYLKDDVVENLTGEDQFIYITGNHSGNSAYALEWNCGGSGIEKDLLPEGCQS